MIAAIDPTPEPSQMVVKQKVKKEAVPQLTTADPNSSKSDKKEIEENHLLKEIANLKGMLADLRSTAVLDIQYPELLEQAHSFLIEQDVEATIRAQIMAPLLEKWRAAKQDVSGVEVQEWLRDSILTLLEWTSKEEMGFNKKYINIVGPTGVGKTTTLAKVAAETMLNQRKKVAFITTDTYRIAAIDQLKTYAKILNVPIEVAYNLEDFKRAADRFSHYDIVFIDTAGRNFRNEQYVKDLGNIIDFSSELETYLVLSLTSKQTDMDAIYRQFSTIPIKQVIFTKADETATYGSMINFIQRNQIAPFYITNGQNVPDDIVRATSTNIVNTILGAYNND